jgi:hypothetical protein
MNFVNWLDCFLKEEHVLELKIFKNWDLNDINKKYLWCNKYDLFKPIKYILV